MSAWEKDIEEKTDILRKMVRINTITLEVMVSQIIKLKEEIVELKKIEMEFRKKQMRE